MHRPLFLGLLHGLRRLPPWHVLRMFLAENRLVSCLASLVVLNINLPESVSLETAGKASTSGAAKALLTSSVLTGN
jgi:hypothetical protein